MTVKLRMEEKPVFPFLQEKEKEEIAIIGLAMRCAGADSKEAYWNNLLSGKNCVGPFPEERKRDVEAYCKSRKIDLDQIAYIKGGYLNEIDQFDYKYFGISKKEACNMEPSQRIFLQTAMHAMIDAGYANNCKGSKTGVFVGYNGNPDYLNVILDAGNASITANTGNMRSMIASRVAYYMDFHGPCMVVDTACSSSLVAVHLACQSLQQGECGLAIAGGVELSLFPVKNQDKLGIESESGMTKSFSNDSDGTVFGEGTVALVLKPLKQALVEKDQIYGIIKGSAVNQDGSSAGITAPNKKAQMDVIRSAWENAEINPEQLSYIETHGTGTTLGDPVEVDAINEVFREYTDKTGFCGIGSVKSNIGHLDSVSGVIGLVKVLLELKERLLLPSLHFSEPNRRISFIDSAVYVNDQVKEWKTEEKEYLAGVSSFGLSGVNCHVVLERHDFSREVEEEKCSLPFVLSAKSAESLKKMITDFYEFLKGAQVSLRDVSYTLACRREHHAYRVAILSNSREQLMYELKQASQMEFEGQAKKQVLYQENQYYLYSSDMLATLEAYMEGKNVSFQNLFSWDNAQVVSVPAYPFEKTRCWISVPEAYENDELEQGSTYLHPLIHKRAICSAEQDIYVSHFSVEKYWILNEHKFMGKYFPAGTTYIEMAHAIGKLYFDREIQIKDFTYIKPLEVKPGTQKEVHILVKKEKGYLGFQVVSKEDDEGEVKWNSHVEGKLFPLELEEIRVDVKALSKEYRLIEHAVSEEEGVEEVIQLGARWTQIKRQFMTDGKNVLVHIEMPEQYYDDLKQYDLHPSLLDAAVNAVTQATGKGFFLPLEQESIKIYKPLEKDIYCLLRPNEEKENNETLSYDISILNPKGNILMDIKRHIIKKVHQERFVENKLENKLFGISYRKVETESKEDYQKNNCVLILCKKNPMVKQILQTLDGMGIRYLTVLTGESYSKGENQFTVGRREEDYQQLLETVKGFEIDSVLYLASIEEKNTWQAEAFQDKVEHCSDTLFFFLKAAIQNKTFAKLHVAIISQYAVRVTGDEAEIRPENNMLSGLGKVLVQEYPNISSHFVDVEEETDPRLYLREAFSNQQGYHATYFRKNEKYEEEFISLKETEKNLTEMKLKKDSVYVVTGGLGGIAYEIIHDMTKTEQVKIVAIGRTELNQGASGDSFEPDETSKKKTERLQDLKEHTWLCDYYAADVADEERMQEVFEEIRRKHGPIKGIIHCAGVTGDGYLFKRDKKDFSQVIKPKVNGSYVLDRVTEADSLDFFVLFSSVTSIAGAAGQGDYTAANSYLDAFTSYRNWAGKKTIAINWSSWKEVGMVKDYGVKERGIFKMLSKEDGVRIFKFLLHAKEERIIVGELNYEFLKETKVNFPLHLSKEIETRIQKQKKNNTFAVEKQREQFVLKGNQGNGYTETQQKVAAAWSEVLMETDLNLTDTFSDLGGDSVLATELLKCLERSYPGLLDITDMFTYNTIEKMSEYIEGKQNGGTKHSSQPKIRKTAEEELDFLLDGLESGDITVDDAKQYSL